MFMKCQLPSHQLGTGITTAKPCRRMYPCTLACALVTVPDEQPVAAAGTSHPKCSSRVTAQMSAEPPCPCELVFTSAHLMLAGPGVQARWWGLGQQPPSWDGAVPLPVSTGEWEQGGPAQAGSRMDG